MARAHTPRQLWRCEVGDSDKTVFCLCGGSKWKAKRVMFEEELVNLPKDDPHYVDPVIFTARATRRLRKEGYIAYRGRIVGKQLDLPGVEVPSQKRRR